MVVVSTSIACLHVNHALHIIDPKKGKQKQVKSVAAVSLRPCLSIEADGLLFRPESYLPTRRWRGREADRTTYSSRVLQGIRPTEDHVR